MIELRGKIENGEIVTDEPIDERFEGQYVEIMIHDDEVEDEVSEEPGGSRTKSNDWFFVTNQAASAVFPEGQIATSL